MAPPSRRATVLVVEDDRGLREFYRTALSVAGFEVIAVEDGLDALQWLEHNAPTVIVLDLGLVRMDGRDVQQELRSRAETRDVPIVVVTGHDTTNLDTPDVACVLKKPVTAEALTETVENCLRQTRR